jgi:uncharacterized protein (TIGR03437 family)
VAVNGVTVQPALYYTSPAQLAAVLPAATPAGTGTLTVTYKGKTSAPAAIQVVPSALGINTYNGNLGVATDAMTGALLTYANSGSPGQTITLWATGLGADPADSDTTLTSTPHSVDTPLQIYLAGVQATILYQGASAYPGVNQINLTIPPSALTGCWVPLAAVTGNAVSNIVMLPINQGGGACHDAQSGLNGNQIPIAPQTLRSGFVALIQDNSQSSPSTVATAAFEKYTGLYPSSTPSPGGCLIVQPKTVTTITGLDVGTITLTGPSGLAITMGGQLGIKGALYSMLPANAIPSSGGTFTFKGSGGADVGPFTSTVTFSSPLLSWTNSSEAAVIDKKQGLRVTWTGGTPGSYVLIYGSASFPGNPSLIIGYTCTAPVEAGQFTVPPYILMSLPGGPAGTGMQNAIDSPLVTAGLDEAMAIGSVVLPGVKGTFK